MDNKSNSPIWAKLKRSRKRVKELEQRVKELEQTNQRLSAERDNYSLDCKSLQNQADIANERFNRVLGVLEERVSNIGEKPMHDYTTLDYHFKEKISLEESKESVMEAASALAMIPHTERVDERAAYCHTIAQCLYEYTDLLKRIG